MIYQQLDMEESGRQQSWQSEVTKNMRRYVEGCNIYQKIKNRTEVLAEKLKLSKVSEKP